MSYFGTNNQNENEKLMEQIEMLNKRISSMKENHKSEIQNLINVFEEEKVRIISKLIKDQKYIYVRCSEDSTMIVELEVNEVTSNHIKCLEGKVERTFPIALIGRTISLTREDFVSNNKDILKLKDNTSEYKTLSVIPSVEQKFWPPKIIGGKHHL